MPSNFLTTRACVIALCTLLMACSEHQAEKTVNNEPQNQQASAIVASGDFIKATTVPNSSSERQTLLKELNSKNDANSKRLALFVRYTELTNAAEIKQEVLEPLLKDIDAQLKANSGDHELRALFGSATSLQAIFHLEDVGQTNLLAKKGGRQLDRAVKKAPNHIGVRMYRGITYAEMPAFLGKARFAKQDFEAIKQATGSNADGDYMAMINYYYAMALIKDNQKDQGQSLLNQVIKSQKAPWAVKAQALLKEAS